MSKEHTPEYCEHKFVLKRNDSFYTENGRYSYIYTSIDYYFCEKCLLQKEMANQATCGEGRHDELPNWARLISKKI